MTATIAMTITACSPNVEAVPLQPSVTESVLKVTEPPYKEMLNLKEAPKTVIQATPVAATPSPSPKPVATPTPKVSSVEQNLINHMLKQVDSKGNPTVSGRNAKKWASLIIEHCATYGVDPYTILAMIQVESEYDPNEVGSSHDTGLLQILPATQKYMKISGDLFNPSINIEIGTKYLAYTQKRFGNDLGIVAYNQGEGNVSRGTYNTKYLTKVNKVLVTIDR